MNSSYLASGRAFGSGKVHRKATPRVQAVQIQQFVYVGPSKAGSAHAYGRDSFIPLKSSWRQPLLEPVSGKRHSVCVALGKFDAMHVGHRWLAEEATRLGGYPCMLSFSGLAQVRQNMPEHKIAAAAQKGATGCLRHELFHRSRFV
jgi:hypothetical protein